MPLSAEPPEGADDVPRLTRFRVRFDRPLDPLSVDRGSVRLESGPQRVFLSVWVDPLDRAVVARAFGEQALEPEVFYRLTVQGVRDLDGRALEEPFTVRFRTAAALGELAEPPAVGWADVQPILTARCAGGGCHGGDRPALGLDLSSAEAVAATALGAPSRQVGSGVGGSEGVAGARGLTGMPIIDALAGVGRPETSYLIYKVLGDPHVLGDPMPPDAAEALDREQMRLLARWIRGGAPTAPFD